MKSCRVLQDELERLRQQVEWQAIRIEYLHQRLLALEVRPMPWSVVPIYESSAPTPTPTPIIPYGPLVGPISQAGGPIKWGGTD